MKFLILTALCAVTLAFVPINHQSAVETLTGQALVDYVNSAQSLFKTEHVEITEEEMKFKLMDGKYAAAHSDEIRATEQEVVLASVPATFDSRTQWSECKSIKLIRDQATCGSCWAFGAVEAMSDRICIASHGELQVTLSADDLLSCCKSCGFGCNGGDPLAAWRYWVKDGIVTGSNYTANNGCKPYPFPPCEHHSKKTHFDPCPHDLYPTPKCEKKCVSDYTDKTYSEDKFFGASAYGVKDDVEAIQKELMTHGPLEIAFEVYEDFLNYDGGVYVHTGGKLGGGHAVKLIGWGIDDGIPYWTVANSWNTDWGEDGFFRILRGVDECGIESGVVGGIPKLNSLTSRLHRHHRRHVYDDNY